MSEKSNERGSTAYQGPEDMTAESMYAGLVSIFVVAVVLFIGISISLAGNTKCCRRRCKCFRRRGEDGEEGSGETNAAFTEGPPPYDVVMRTDTRRNGSRSGQQVDVYTISGSADPASAGSTTVLCIQGDNRGAGESVTQTGRLARQGSGRRSLRSILGNPPNYFDVLRSWTSNKVFVTGAPSATDWKASTPPPKYSDVEKQMEEERKKRDDDNSAA